MTFAESRLCSGVPTAMAKISPLTNSCLVVLAASMATYSAKVWDSLATDLLIASGTDSTTRLSPEPESGADSDTDAESESESESDGRLRFRV